MAGQTVGHGASPWVREDGAQHTFRVARDAFTQDAILSLERENIFDRCWIYVGHESEIPERNDYLTRQVAGREVIFNRDRGGAVHVFLNICPHRGAMVAREKKGNALGFQCFYHGWAFNNNGRFATQIAEGNYPPDFNAQGCANLTEVPRLESHRGFWFVNFDRNACGLIEYLADAAAIIDLVADQSEVGMEIVGGTQEYGLQANWKLLLENSFDGYHAISTHATYFDYLANTAGSMTQPLLLGDSNRSRGVDLGNGHGMVEYPAPWGRPVAQWIKAWGEDAKAEVEAKERRLVELFGAERGHRMARLNRNMVIFPNLVINDIMAITVRTFYPTTPGQLAVNAWTLAPKNEAPEMRRWRLYNFLEFLGPGGFATPDDVEALESCQRAYCNAREAGWNDISKGMMKASPAADDEAQMRSFWREWDRRVGAGVMP